MKTIIVAVCPRFGCLQSRQESHLGCSEFAGRLTADSRHDDQTTGHQDKRGWSKRHGWGPSVTGDFVERRFAFVSRGAATMIGRAP